MLIHKSFQLPEEGQKDSLLCYSKLFHYITTVCKVLDRWLYYDTILYIAIIGQPYVYGFPYEFQKNSDMLYCRASIASKGEYLLYMAPNGTRGNGPWNLCSFILRSGAHHVSPYSHFPKALLWVMPNYV